MKKYTAEYERKTIQIGFKVSYINSHSSTYKNIKYQVFVLTDEKYTPIDDLAEYTYLIGPAEAHIRGYLNTKTKDLIIENIQKGFILKGQEFMINTINTLLELDPDIETVSLANINNTHTLNFIKKCIIEDYSLDQVKGDDRNPLLSSLDKCGFLKQEIYSDGSYAFVQENCVDLKLFVIYQRESPQQGVNPIGVKVNINEPIVSLVRPQLNHLLGLKHLNLCQAYRQK